MYDTATMNGSPPVSGDPDDFLTVRDVQEILLVSRGTVYNMIHGIKHADGTYRQEPVLPYYRVGSWGIRIKRADLDKLRTQGGGAHEQ